MKIFTRIATALTAAFVSLFVAAPAFAATAHGDDRVDATAAFSAAGQPVDVVAILITGGVLLAVVLLLSVVLGGLFAPASEPRASK